LLGCEKKPPLPPTVYPVTTVMPITRDAPLYFEYVGHVEAFKVVDVKSQVEGVLVKRHFEEGQEVKKGDLLITIDPRPYEAALQRAEATVALNRANLKLAEETARRYARLVTQDYVAKLDYDQYLTNVAVTKAQVEQSIADLEEAKINLGYCYIRAPMDSITSNVIVYEGNLIPNAGDEPLVTLTQIVPIYVNFFIPEKDLPLIQSYQKKGCLQTEAFLNHDYSHSFEGTLTSINNRVDESTGTILLQATFPNDNKCLWPGEYIDVRLIYDVAKNALLLPSQAIQVGQSGPYVYIVKEDQTVEMRNIITGQREDDYTIVKKGLKEGETVVLEGQLNLSPGAKVSIKQKK
jgi:multidrug efflux system membrane fusion protein